METNPPTSELMSPVHSFPNRFFSSDFHNDEELNAQASVYTYMPVDGSRSSEVPVRSPDVLISNKFMNSAFHDDEVMDNEQASQDSGLQFMPGAGSGSSHGPSVFAESSRDPLDGPSNPYFVFDTPQGTRYWIPNVADKFIPVCGKSYPTFEDVLSMYELYAFEAGFSVKKGQTKVWNGIPTHKYLRCSKYGKPQPKRTFDTLDESSLKPWRTNFTWCDCKASILVSISNDSYTVLSFNDIHNHELVESYNRDLSKISRKLSFSTKQFIHNMSLNRIGPMRAYRCLVALKGGHHNVNGTPVDFKNFSHQLRILLLSSVFWADEISKLNYKAFGDVLAFDATYSTNRYKMVFVPFTGVDHHFQCVAFGAGLISTESIESYVWLLKAFLKSHGTQPTLVLSDQDPSMLQAVPMVFTESHHRLCMWHIMKKLPSKISADVLDNTDLRSCIHRLVWNVYIKPETFESRWNDLLQTFGLQSHTWLNDMYNIKHLWVPACFRELPMCCLMKTTSRCESSNAAFKVNSTSANTLVQFMMCFENRVDSQRYRQRVSEYKTSSTVFTTDLAIEQHAFAIYTNAVFAQVQKEIIKGKFLCYITNQTESSDSSLLIDVTHLDKRNNITNVYQVTYNTVDHSASCSCRNFTRIGYLCRHVFCVYRLKNVAKIPPQYINDRWRRDALPKQVFSLSSRYGVNPHAPSVMRNEILDLVTECVDVARTDEDSLSKLVDQLRDFKINVLSKQPLGTIQNETNECEMEEIVGQPINIPVEVANPEVVRNKGCGTHTRISGPGEKAKAKPPKRPKQLRLCKRCGLYVDDHDSRNCVKVAAMKAAKAAAEQQRQTAPGASPSD
ncbi:protein FAR1-RELATED SEQUENCE 5-like [Helianthus annuus]|uniref:protein FAR1-RELATED SEQUENCE 5-like n=1 Tax=Helianthus annuus TaxID=4232 RepID=UPI000B8F8897|nr:protein FAR1-RELATED SEQUENCE 5-like [Helianthus annuus]